MAEEAPDPTVRMPLAILQRHCAAPADKYNRCVERCGAEGCAAEFQAVSDCTLPVMYQYVAVKRLCGAQEDALIKCKVDALGDPQCDALMMDLSRCVEKRANPRALHCLEAGIAVRDV
eukprot:GGOE01041697.1.p3 GENE.GGOE01041697.1~~GGOE01041697.1.p3  ORF type:complete len:130 (+),score=47.60 GGOE01041697.1:38-391(+)